jgi:hypothetical protein
LQHPSMSLFGSANYIAGVDE